MDAPLADVLLDYSGLVLGICIAFVGYNLGRRYLRLLGEGSAPGPVGDDDPFGDLQPDGEPVTVGPAHRADLRPPVWDVYEPVRGRPVPDGRGVRRNGLRAGALAPGGRVRGADAAPLMPSLWDDSAERLRGEDW